MSKLFTADWCGNCQPIKKLIETNGYDVEIVNVDNNPDLVRDSGVRSVPSLLLDNGNLVVGTAEIKRVIEETYGAASNTN